MEKISREEYVAGGNARGKYLEEKTYSEKRSGN